MPYLAQRRLKNGNSTVALPTLILRWFNVVKPTPTYSRPLRPFTDVGSTPPCRLGHSWHSIITDLTHSWHSIIAELSHSWHFIIPIITSVLYFKQIHVSVRSLPHGNVNKYSGNMSSVPFSPIREAHSSWLLSLFSANFVNTDNITPYMHKVSI
jgi:hypothetical protein